MFNVTVIKLKDIIKIIAIILIAYILGKFIFKNIQICAYPIFFLNHNML